MDKTGENKEAGAEDSNGGGDGAGSRRPRPRQPAGGIAEAAASGPGMPASVLKN